MTPIQELKAKLLKRFKHVNNYELYSTIDDHINNEKEFAKKCFVAGQNYSQERNDFVHYGYGDPKYTEPDFEQFYRQIIK